MLKFKEETPLAKRILGCIVLTFFMVFLTSPIFLFFKHNFIPSKGLFFASVFLSFVVCCVVAVCYLCAFKAGSIKPIPQLKAETKFKKAFISVLFPFICLFWVWSFIGVMLPSIATNLMGGLTESQMLLVKQSGGKNKCKYRLHPRGLESFIFHYCIGEMEYTEINQEVLAVVISKQTIFGLVVLELHFIDEER